MDSKVFWNRVETKHRSIEGEFKSGRLKPPQPQDGETVFITSIENFDRGTVDGAVSLAGYRLAAQRIIEATHRLSSADEITRFNQERTAEDDRFREKERRLAERKTTTRYIEVQVPASANPAQDAGKRK